MVSELKELHKDERGVFAEIIGLTITGAIVTYVIVIFMGEFLSPVLFPVIDSALGVSLAGTVKFLIGAITFFIVLGLLVKIWGIASGSGGGGGYAPQY